MQIEFPWRMLLNFHCQVQQENGQLHQSNGAFPSANAKSTDWPCWHTWEPQNHPRRRRAPVLWQWIAWSRKTLLFHHTIKLGCSGQLWERVLRQHFFKITRCFLSNIHNSRRSLAHNHLHNSSGLRTTPEQKTRNLFQKFQRTEFQPMLCLNWLWNISRQYFFADFYWYPNIVLVFPFQSFPTAIRTKPSEKITVWGSHRFISKICAYGCCPCFPAGQRCNQEIWTP